MILKRAAIIFGVVFILVGILGFVPGVTTNEMLLSVIALVLGLGVNGRVAEAHA
jgi:hypothetical protein